MKNSKHFFKVVQTQYPKLNKLYKDLFKGGKGVRARLVRDLCSCLKISSSNTSFLCECVENIHHSSILHDDVIDASRFRRNRLASWIQFSQQEAILAGDYLMAHVSFRISEKENLPLLTLTSEAIKNMVLGEWLQRELIGRETVKGLNQVHIYKTASLFEWSVRAPFIFINENKKQFQVLLGQIGVIFGQLFQRSDDMIDFGIRNKEGKDEFKDLKEGYLNFFGTYLKEKGAFKSIKALRACQNKEQLRKLISEKKLNTYLKDFDQMNLKLSQSCLKKINELQKYLKQDQKETLSVLKSWIDLLYCRDLKGK